MVHFYKNIRETEIKVGIFVILSFLVLFVSYSWLNDWFLKNKYEKIKVVFENVNNIEKGNSVFYRGVRVGRVDNLIINTEGVIVELLISQKLDIREDAIFIIKESDMMGTRVIDIIPGKSNSVVDAFTVYRGRALPGLSDLVSNLNVLSGQIENIMLKLDIHDNLLGRIDNVLALTENSFQLVSEILQDAQEKEIITAFVELKQLSLSFQKILNDNSDNLDTAFKQANYTLTGIDSFLVQMNIVLDSFNKQLENKDSNLNKVLNDDQLYKNLLKTTQEMEFLLNDIKKNPRKYFKFSIF